MILDTARLTLRPLAESDAANFHAMVSDPETMRFWDVAAITDFEMTTEILAGQLFEVASGSALYWAIERTADQTFVGTCDISDINRQHRRADIGFLLVRPYWGMGYAFEAMQAAIAHAKAQLIPTCENSGAPKPLSRSSREWEGPGASLRREGEGPAAARESMFPQPGINLQRLSARTHLGNTRSIALLTKLGFQQEGILRGYVERDNERRDCPVFGLLL